MSQDSLSRRGFLRRATGTSVGAAAATGAAVGVAAGSATASSGTTGSALAQSTRPNWGGWLDGVDGGFEDARGQSEVTVKVGTDGNGGPYAFSPAGLWVDPGTTVTWEWVSDTHNVVPQSQPEGTDWNGSAGAPGKTFDSGHTYQHTFETTGIRTYFCNPHKPLGMKGGVAVGDDVPTGGDGNGGGNGGQDGGTGGFTTPTVVAKAESSLVTMIFGLLSIAFVVIMTAATLHLSYLDHKIDQREASGEGEGEGDGEGET